MLYSTVLKNYGKETKLKIVEASDRLQIYLDGQHKHTQYQEEIGQEILLDVAEKQEEIQVDCLVENLGRVNYGFKFNHPSQQKGIRGGMMHDIHFHQGYTQYPLDFSAEQLSGIDFSAGKNPAQPSFYRFNMSLDKVADTFIDCSNYGKGVIIVNGKNLGRYWNQGPVYSLYCPKAFLHEGENEILVFETEAVEITSLNFSSQPVFDTLK